MTPGPKGSTKAERAKPWTEVIGRHPYNVQIVERTDKGLEIYLRFNDPVKVAARARDPRTWRVTGLKARDALGQKWNEEVRQQARVLAEERGLELRTGKPTKPEVPAAEPETSVTTKALTIGEGVALATALDGTGMLSAPLGRDGKRHPDRVTKEIIARSKTMLRIVAVYDAEEADKARTKGKRPPAPLTWNSFTPVHADYVVRKMAEEHVVHGKHGFSVAEKMLDEFYRMARWLHEHRKIEATCAPRTNWKVAAKKEWGKNASPVPKKKRPRHTEPEMRGIFSALDDPRGRLIMKLHRGARLSLFADRCWSHLRLERTAHRPHGGMVVQESAANVYVRVFDETQRALIDQALTTGYLRRYEAARAAGKLSDYPLFAEGQLVQFIGEAVDFAPALTVNVNAKALASTGANVLTIDPRIRLAVELGAALRLGQVNRTRRSQVDTEKFFFFTDEEDAAPQAVGIVDVQGRGNKESPGIALSGFTRQALEDAFEGYLCEFEALYQAGEIEDYPLIPAGRLDRGIANPRGRYAQQEATRDAALGWFHELEAAAGVQQMKGRGWYGLRRILIDTAPKYTSNEMTLNTLAGTSTDMRNSVYQDQESLEAKIDAANTYERIRTGGRVSGTTPAPNPLLVNPALAKALSIYSADEIRAAIAHLEGQRAARQTASDGQSNTVDPDEKTDAVDPSVDPNTKARVHEGATGFASADLES
jgi:hypothetical protein